ncbi:MAG: type II toxin-antitoxin system VapC family toxin [Cyanobacteria bacterium]|nr:type II toxin-antitoxin system VapC family toxin [Cyanobacteriota bacterium]
MILYCDTSALIKLLIREPHSDQMQEVCRRAEAIAVGRITWAEVMAGLARRQRVDPASGDDLEQARQNLIQSWQSFAIVEVSQKLVETAGRFADAFSLRAYDSVQLAAAHALQAATDEPVTFACFDRRLNQAALLLQLAVLP